MKRGFIFVFFGFIVLTQYVNCSNSSQDSTYEGSVLGLPSIDATQYQSVMVLNTDTYMNCSEDNVQVGGTCNTANAADNFIRYSISVNRQTVYWGTGASQTDHLDLAKCENGHFFAVIPKPNDPVNLAVTATDFVEYQLQFQLYTSNDKLTYTAGEIAPNFTMNVQKNGGCN